MKYKQLNNKDGRNMENVMQYEDIKPHKNIKVSKKLTSKPMKKLAMQNFDSLSTSTILWAVMKRHKYGLMVNAFIVENILLVCKFLGVV